MKKIQCLFGKQVKSFVHWKNCLKINFLPFWMKHFFLIPFVLFVLATFLFAYLVGSCTFAPHTSCLFHILYRCQQCRFALLALCVPLLVISVNIFIHSTRIYIYTKIWSSIAIINISGCNILC